MYAVVEIPSRMREKMRKRMVLRYALRAVRDVAILTGTSAVDFWSVSDDDKY
jgi:hypothetical protein